MVFDFRPFSQVYAEGRRGLSSVVRKLCPGFVIDGQQAGMAGGRTSAQSAGSITGEWLSPYTSWVVQSRLKFISCNFHLYFAYFKLSSCHGTSLLYILLEIEKMRKLNYNSTVKPWYKGLGCNGHFLVPIVKSNANFFSYKRNWTGRTRSSCVARVYLLHKRNERNFHGVQLADFKG